MEKFKHRLLKETRVDPDFNRNSGETASIWGKWLQSKLTDRTAREVLDFLNKE